MIESREIRYRHFAPRKPDSHLIRLIHRDHPDSVVIACQTREGWIQPASLCASDLKRRFSLISANLDEDAFFSIHGFFGAAKSKCLWSSDLHQGLRTRDRLQWLTACFADLDLHREGLDVNGAIARVHELESNGSLPRVSIFVRSGRGIWLLWLIRARDLRGPLRARDRQISIFHQIQIEILRRLHELCPDDSARDGSRVMRIPGSKNSKSGTRVSYSVAFERGSTRPLSYLFDELADAFDVKPVQHRSQDPQEIDTVAQEHGRKGPERRAAINLRRFWALAHLRSKSGFAVGTRHHAAWFLALWLRAINQPKDVATRVVGQFFSDHCSKVDSSGRPDVIGRNEAFQTVRSAYGTSNREIRLRSQTIANRLAITPDEAWALDELGDVPWPAAVQFSQDGPIPRTKRGRAAVLRRKAIDSIMHASGSSHSLNELRTLLAARGIRASRETIRRDLESVGRRSTGKPGRKHADAPKRKRPGTTNFTSQ